MADEIADEIAYEVATTEPGSPEEVAFWLMERIAKAEVGKVIHGEQGKRSYWLSLYSECLRATKGQPPEQPPKSN